MASHTLLLTDTDKKAEYRPDSAIYRTYVNFNIMKTRCEINERKSTGFWKVFKRHGYAEHRGFYCLGTDHSIIYRNRLVSK